MHLHVAIPLAASIGACAITSTILARDPTARRSRIAAAILIAACAWGLCDFFAAMLAKRGVALSLIRLSTVPVLAIPPLALHLGFEQGDELRRRFGPLLWPVWLGSALIAPVALATDQVIADVFWTTWGWSTRMGPLYALVFVPGVVCMSAALMISASRGTREAVAPFGRREGRVLVWASTLLLTVVPLTEVFAPLTGIPAPRLGALCVTVLGAILWFLSLSFGEYVPPPAALSREILDNLRNGVALITRDGRVRAANPVFARLRGVDPDQLVGTTVGRWMGVEPADIPDGGSELETTLEQRDGLAIPVSVSRALLRDDEGAHLGSVLVVRDLREVVRLRRRLVTAGRLAAVGELAAGIVHEVNNPVAFIQSNLHFLQKNDASTLEILGRELGEERIPPPLRDIGHLVGQSLQEIARVTATVKEIRGFSHMGTHGVQANDVNALLEDAVRIALPQLRARATLVREYRDVPHVECDGQDIRHVMLELVFNAARGLHGMGIIRLRTEADAEGVTIEVSDDGSGYSASEVERIFEPTVDREDGRAASDLCVADQIVRQHGGTIEMTSELDQGTTVRVQLPLCPPNRGEGSAPGAFPSAPQ
ncbi:MAG: ATP-binding protein [Myxococcota bacterium]|jgi:PAS domain S-box-containing protein|nr:ATP-binding protein [Myxococcota bacterium]